MKFLVKILLSSVLGYLLGSVVYAGATENLANLATVLFEGSLPGISGAFIGIFFICVVTMIAEEAPVFVSVLFPALSGLLGAGAGLLFFGDLLYSSFLSILAAIFGTIGLAWRSTRSIREQLKQET